MKPIGVVRKVDDLGRIVFPVELRRIIGIEKGDSVEFFVDGENIILRQYHPACTFCGKVAEIRTEYKGRIVCSSCRNDIKKLLD